MIRRVLKRLVAVVAGLLLLFVLALVGFRFASQARETASRVDAAPRAGQFITSGDVGIYVQEAGPRTGIPVVLIHGVGAWSETWRPTINVLAQVGYRVIAVDLPPFGYSFRPASGDYSTEAQAKRILGVLDALKIESAVLVGHSFGGRATVEAAMSAPQRVRALVLVCAALGLQDPPAEEPGFVTHVVLGTPPVRNAVVATLATNPLLTGTFLRAFTERHDPITSQRIEVYQRPQLVTGSTEALGRWFAQFVLSGERPKSRQPDMYRALKVPALVIWGERDSVTPLSQAQHLASLLPDAALVTMPGTGHIPQLENELVFNGLLVEHLPRRLAPR
jgi:pimeloyl-ACP methyl ester carboxylesterase